MELQEAKTNFIHSWGVLGSNWGINRTMAQIHALLLISNEPISTEDIMEVLQISRGNANMNIRQLMDWGIVSKEYKIGERREYFVGDKDIWAVARQISRQRKQREIEPLLKVLADAKGVKGNDEETKQFKEVVSDINDFTIKVDDLFDKFIKSDEHWFYKTMLKLFK
jgi:DNA-binding transcriptional regulator GbsR (MarR family)